VYDLPSLDHELLDNAMESGTLITKALLASGKSARIVSQCSGIMRVPECFQVVCHGQSSSS
jgi:hypothetical protein